MTVYIKLSSKGQVVLPKGMRDALKLEAGEQLAVTLKGRSIIMEAPPAPIERISYEEFRRRVPRYRGPPASIEDMNRAVDEMFAKKGRP